MNDLAARWDACKQRLGAHLGPDDAAAWLPGLTLLHLDPEHAVLGGVPNSFFRTRIQTRFRELILYCLAEGFPELLVAATEAGGDGASGDHQPRALHDVTLECRLLDSASQLPLPLADASARETAAQSAPASGKAAQQARSQWEPSFRLDTWVEGPGNAEAVHLARKVVAAPGGKFNPFFVWGGPGLGKTHLLQGMGHDLTDQGLKVLYLSAEQYKVEVLEAIQRRRMKPVRERHRAVDALIMDDLQFLLVTPKAQEELLHTFDLLRAAGKQIVLAADRLPRAMAGLNPTLRSRLETGLIAELEPPDVETRLRFLKARAERDGIALGDAEARLLAERIENSPRQLEGALVRLAAYSALQQRPITRAFVEEIAEPFMAPEPEAGPQLAQALLAAVCERFGTTPRALRARQKSAGLVKARHALVWLLKEAAGMSYPEIGRLLGGRAPSTLSHAYHSVRDELTRSPHQQRLLRQLREQAFARSQGSPAARSNPGRA